MINGNTNSITNNNINNNLNTLDVDLKTSNSETDYPNLFRGLSSIVLDSFNSLVEPKPDIDSEKTFTDLSDLVFREQINQSSTTANATITTTTTLNPIETKFNPALLSSPIHIQEQQKMSVNDSSEDSCSLSSSSFISKAKPVKRLTNATSHPSTSGLVDDSKKPRRGRKPSSMNPDNDIATKGKLKKLQKEKELNKPVVCFGNKVVEKNTDEYKKRRESNNVAVKKCREKLNEKQKEREERMSALNQENKRLNDTVETLFKELNVLKNIIIQMSPEKKLPEHIQNMFKNVDE